MIKCSFLIKGLTNILVILIAFKTTNAVGNTVNLKDIYSVIENLVGPILKSVNIQVSEDGYTTNTTPNINKKGNKTLQNSTKDNDPINNEILTDDQEKFIDGVVNNLQNSSILKNVQPDEIQRRFNNDTSDEEVPTDDSEETIILRDPNLIELQPNRRNIDTKTISTNITNDRSEIYKELQNKIGGLLNKEQISNETKRLISNAFDKVVNQMNNKCVFRASQDLSSNAKFRVGKPEKRAMKTMLKLYNSQFNKLIDGYSFDSKENSRFLRNLRELFFEMHNSFKKFTLQDDLQCKVVKHKSKKHTKHSSVHTTTEHKNILREKHTTKSSKCEIRSICPFELKMYLADFAMSVLETIDLVFNNYKKMYLADVTNEESGEEKRFLQVMRDTNRLINKKFNETFIEEIYKLDMDSSADIKAKVAKVDKFIGGAVSHIKALVNGALTDELIRIPSKMQSTVNKDIMTNMDIEMVNMVDKIKSKMCKAFQTCYTGYSMFEMLYTHAKEEYSS
ncbi:uncharacterized protein LOC125231308 [Leguminivora glycinivorella]|uniref:uncharacterized protein LOC125231308 n=1 Tax=Leguminivora glycinivorella TaxID=1035111 RepID=UPI00200C6034|nr:uncharacterized protein LOC125231308 [Leguminivora glycinivorella]